MTMLAEYLRTHRIRQDDFAKRVGVTQSTVSKWASGLIKPGIDDCFTIARLTEGEVPVSSWVDPAVLSDSPAPSVPPVPKDAA